MTWHTHAAWISPWSEPKEEENPAPTCLELGCIPGMPIALESPSRMWLKLLCLGLCLTRVLSGFLPPFTPSFISCLFSLMSFLNKSLVFGISVLLFASGQLAWNKCTRSGVPSLQGFLPDDLSWSWYNSNRKCTINAMCLNYPETIPPPQSVEKLSSKKLVPSAKELGDRWATGLDLLMLSCDFSLCMDFLLLL